MACDLKSQPSMADKSTSCLSITILIVDDDCATLSIVSSMLKLCKFAEFSFVEMNVTTAENSTAALSALRTKKSFDLVLTDLHMPEMDGIQLKKQIDIEFKLPVLVMSADTNKNVIQRILACGALQFFKKPIKAADVKMIWTYAVTAKKGKSIMPVGADNTEKNNNKNNNSLGAPMKAITFHNNNDPNASSSSSTVNTWNELPKDKDDDNSDNNNNSNDGCGYKKDKDRKRKSPSSSEDDDEDGVSRRAAKKAKVVWTNSLHDLFLQAIRHIGLEKAVPKKILEFMNVPGLTRENVASHLQKYRIFLKKVAERGMLSSSMLASKAVASNFSFGLSFPSQRSSYRHSSRHGYGHSRLLNTSLPLPRRRQSVFDPTRYTSTTRPSYGIGSGSNSYGTNLLSQTAPNPYGSTNLLSQNAPNPYGSTNLLSQNAPNPYGSTNLLSQNAPTPYGSTHLLSQNAGLTNNNSFQTPKEPKKSNLFNPFKPISASYPSNYGSSSSKFGTNKAEASQNNFSSGLNTSTLGSYGANYAGIGINDNGDFLGIGSMKLNGAGSSSNAANLGGNMSQGFGNFPAQEGSSSNPFGVQPMPNDLPPKNDNAMEDFDAIFGDDVFTYSDFDKLSLSGIDHIPCDSSNFSFNFNQKQNDEIAVNPVPMDTSNNDEAMFAEMNRFLDVVPNEVNLSEPQNPNNQGVPKGNSDDHYAPVFDENANQVSYEEREQTADEIFKETTFEPVWTEDELIQSFFDNSFL